MWKPEVILADTRNICFFELDINNEKFFFREFTHADKGRKKLFIIVYLIYTKSMIVRAN